MRRCLQLARNGLYTTRPNPMVGAVIVADGRIIGEGAHMRYGGPHAEVAAFSSVRPEDEALLHGATLYVTLEPCSHYGKTPPCALLVAGKGVRAVVAGTEDPNPEVAGKGFGILRSAGIEVRAGVLEAECRHLNRPFFAVHTLARPYVTLKWAQSANGLIDLLGKAHRFSTRHTSVLAHKLRAEHSAILVGAVTDAREHPQLDTRLWNGPSPERMVLSRPESPHSVLAGLMAKGGQSLLVEGGAKTLQSFIAAGLWDTIRVETSPEKLPGGTEAPSIPADALPSYVEHEDGNTISYYTNPSPARL